MLYGRHLFFLPPYTFSLKFTVNKFDDNITAYKMCLMNPTVTGNV